MHKDIDELSVEFNFKAKEAFYLVFTKFNNKVAELNRQDDENVFQMTRAQFGYGLKAELEKIAKSIIEKSRELKDIDQLKRNLTNRIHDYLQEFMMKSQSA